MPDDPGRTVSELRQELSKFRELLLDDIRQVVQGLHDQNEQFQTQQNALVRSLVGAHVGVALPEPPKPTCPPVPELKEQIAPELAPRSSSVTEEFNDFKSAVWQQAVGADNSDVEAAKLNTRGAFGDLSKREKIVMDDTNYDVEDFYFDKGCCQRIARSELFKNITLSVIAINAVYIGVEQNENDAPTMLDSDLGFQIMDHAFCVFFLFEWIVRFGSFRSKCDCLKDGWFKFDSALVLMMVAETWGMLIFLLIVGSGENVLPTGPLRLLRLLRLTRMARLMRSLPELLTMVKGMKVASRAVGASLFMVLILIYGFAIVMHMLQRDNLSMVPYFGSIPRCMWTLMMDGTFMDSTGAVLGKLLAIGDAAAYITIFLFFCFILLSAMTVMNMLIGVLCEVVSAVGQAEKDQAAINAVKETILVQLMECDEDGNKCISKKELEYVIRSPEAISVLKSLDVDVGYLMELQNLLFADDEAEVSIETIMNLMLTCRGDLPVTVKHMNGALAFTRYIFCTTIENHTNALQDVVDGLKKQMNATLLQLQQLQYWQQQQQSPKMLTNNVSTPRSQNGSNGLTRAI